MRVFSTSASDEHCTTKIHACVDHQKPCRRRGAHRLDHELSTKMWQSTRWSKTILLMSPAMIFNVFQDQWLFKRKFKVLVIYRG